MGDTQWPCVERLPLVDPAQLDLTDEDDRSSGAITLEPRRSYRVAGGTRPCGT